jgi:hypothetical protein
VTAVGVQPLVGDPLDVVSVLEDAGQTYTGNDARPMANAVPTPLGDGV